MRWANRWTRVTILFRLYQGSGDCLVVALPPGNWSNSNVREDPLNPPTRLVSSAAGVHPGNLLDT
jgi:hypothetical protein